jgi:hypothetical protein
LKRVVIDCFQLRVKAGNEGQRAALRSRRREMRDCDGGCGAVPLAAAVERRRRRGPKGKRLACVGASRTRHKQLLGDWSPATSKTVPVCLATSHKSTHTSAHGPHTQLLHLFDEPTLVSQSKTKVTKHSTHACSSPIPRSTSTVNHSIFAPSPPPPFQFNSRRHFRDLCAERWSKGTARTEVADMRGNWRDGRSAKEWF